MNAGGGSLFGGPSHCNDFALSNLVHLPVITGGEDIVSTESFGTTVPNNQEDPGRVSEDSFSEGLDYNASLHPGGSIPGNRLFGSQPYASFQDESTSTNPDLDYGMEVTGTSTMYPPDEPSMPPLPPLRSWPPSAFTALPPPGPTGFTAPSGSIPPPILPYIDAQNTDPRVSHLSRYLAFPDQQTIFNTGKASGSAASQSKRTATTSSHASRSCWKPASTSSGRKKRSSKLNPDPLPRSADVSRVVTLAAGAELPGNTTITPTVARTNAFVAANTAITSPWASASRHPAPAPSSDSILCWEVIKQVPGLVEGFLQVASLARGEIEARFWETGTEFGNYEGICQLSDQLSLDRRIVGPILAAGVDSDTKKPLSEKRAALSARFVVGDLDPDIAVMQSSQYAHPVKRLLRLEMITRRKELSDRIENARQAAISAMSGLVFRVERHQWALSNLRADPNGLKLLGCPEVPMMVNTSLESGFTDLDIVVQKRREALPCDVWKGNGWNGPGGIPVYGLAYLVGLFRAQVKKMAAGGDYKDRLSPEEEQTGVKEGRDIVLSALNFPVPSTSSTEEGENLVVKILSDAASLRFLC